MAEKGTDLISASALGPLTKKKDTIAEILVDDQNIEKLTELKKLEPLQFALLADIFRTIDNMMKAKTMDEYEETPLDEIRKDIYRHRISLDRMGRAELREVSKIHIAQEESKVEKKKGILRWLKR